MIYSLAFLAGALTAVEAATSFRLWCALPKGQQPSELSSGKVSFRGEYRDFDLFVESGNIMGDCKDFKPHMHLSDGLWVIEEPTKERVEATKAKLVAAGLPIYFESGFSVVVGGAEVVPDVSGLDGCGASEDTSIIPVPTHSVSFPKLSDKRRRDWAAAAQTNPTISAAVAAVNEKSLVASVEAMQLYHTRNSYSEIIYEAQEYLAGRMEELGFSVELQQFRPDMAPNVVATWPTPVEPTEWIVAGAHYDSRGQNSSSPTDRAPGADDNGSGTSCMLELATVVSTTDFPLTRGLKICFFAGEEQGLLGSQALASAWSEEGKNIVAMVNADMLGYQAGDEITLGFKDRSVTPELVTLSKQLTALYVPGLPTADSSSCCSDYLSFYENGFPSVGFFESGMAASDYPSYHTDTDLLANVNTAQLKLETQAVVATVLTLSL